MRKFFLHLIIIFFFLFILSPVILARSGCCSSHSGVRADGCGCNDGTPLSSTCAPYYTCTANRVFPTDVPILLPTWTPKPLPTNTFVPLPTYTLYPTYTPMPTTVLTLTPKLTEIIKKKTIRANVVKKVNNQRVKKKSFWQWLFNK